MEIKELLNKCAEIGIKREAIAERAGTSVAMIGHYKTGHRNPSEKSADNIRKAIKTIGEELLIINLEYSTECDDEYEHPNNMQFD